MRRFLLILVWPLFTSAQIQVSGSIHPYDLYRISDGSEISLPFRLAELKIGYTWGNLDFRVNSALESRWKTGRSEFDLREAYLVWYPDFGEVRLGKQIFAWGAADGNNPTDNLSAYDYYYLFLPGTDRKIGSLAAAVNLYPGKWQIKAVVIPEYQENRLPFDEPDFPIAPPIQPTAEQIVDVDNPLELGIRVQTTIRGSDISVSYFRGNDRLFSLLGMDFGCPGEPGMHFGYRSTEALGTDLVAFWGALTLRGEAAYFRTSNQYDEGWVIKLETEAEYVQYVLEAEFQGPFDIQFMVQYLGNSILKAKGTTMDLATREVVALEKDNFRAGSGTPFAMFVDHSLLFSAIGNALDNRLELMASGFMDLKEQGYMVGLNVDYSPLENWSIETSLIKLFGDSDPDNIFNQLEDFSHLRVGLKYSF